VSQVSGGDINSAGIGELQEDHPGDPGADAAGPVVAQQEPSELFQA
jgi:hypothetical protein